MFKKTIIKYEYGNGDIEITEKLTFLGKEYQIKVTKRDYTHEDGHFNRELCIFNSRNFNDIIDLSKVYMEGLK